MPTLRVEQFDLPLTLESGQIFRYDRIRDRFLIRTGERGFCVAQRNDHIEYHGIDRNALVRFFRLDEDLRLREPLRSRHELRPLLDRWAGLRLIRQEPWECLVSFVTSSCCNIPRIRRLLNALCQHAGRPALCGNAACSRSCPLKETDERPRIHTFPLPADIPDAATLRSLGFGFRADFLASISQSVTPASLEGLRSQSYADACRLLRHLPGVGQKVADCVLLFALDFSEAFPIDVHVRRAALRRLFNGRPARDAEIRRAALDYYGTHAGFAQQLFFLCSRNGLASECTERLTAE